MRITEIKTYVLVADNADVSLTSSAQDTILVEIYTDDGIIGYGETDTNPWVAKALIDSPGTHTMDQSMKDILIGKDPLNISKRWEELYIGTAMTGRRGAGVNAIGAIDMALWDIKGKYEGKPVYELMGGNVHDTITPYASLQPLGSSFEEYRDSLVEWAERAKKLGFKAVKSEVTMNGPYAHNGMSENDDKHTLVIEAVRNALGPDIKLMVDVQYKWRTAEDALRTVKDWKDFDIYFLETPVWTDNLDDYSRMHEEAPMKIAAGEWLTTYHEFKDLIEKGKVDVAQPDIGRVGGLTEAKKVSNSMKDEAKESAKEMADKIISDAKKVIDSEKDKAMNDVKNTLAELSIDFAEKIIRKELSKDSSQKKYVDDLIKEINNSK